MSYRYKREPIKKPNTILHLQWRRVINGAEWFLSDDKMYLNCIDKVVSKEEAKEYEDREIDFINNLI